MKICLRDLLRLNTARSVKGIALTAVALAAAVTAHPTQAQAQTSGGSIGDLDGYADEASFVDEVEYASDQYSVGDLTAEQAAGESYSPISYSDLYVDGGVSPAVMHSQGHAMSGACGCTATSTGSCGKANCRTRSIGGMLGKGNRKDLWMTAEMLLWFPQARRAPALITEAPTGFNPTIGPSFPNTETVFGGEGGVGGDLAPGFRIDAGRYLSKNFGLGGRFWFLGEDSETYSASGDGSQFNVGRPFFDTSSGQNDALLVIAENNVGDTLFTGRVNAETKLDMIAAEGYGRLMFAEGDEYRTDLIGGYTYYGIDDMLSIESSATEVTPATGTNISFRDLFETTNDFHGGQIGFETVLTRGKWMFSSLTKVHLGNMAQTLNIQGTATETLATNPPTVTSLEGGLLALDSQGTYERDVFSFVPEANVKVGYRFRDHVLFTVGYSFIYWSNVATAGEHINPVFDGTTRVTAGPFGQPPLVWQDTSLIVQGIDLGLVIDF